MHKNTTDVDSLSSDVNIANSANAPTSTSEIPKFASADVLIIRNAKLDQVREFIKANCNLAPQGSEEWLKTRQSIIGGSELSILIGKNPFSTIADLVATKCNLVKYAGNVATRWGTIFEEMTRMIVRMLYLPDIEWEEECIYETGSLEGVIPHHRFSPDGLTVIICKNLATGELRPMIVLLEFKSPLSSIPSGVVPPYYLPQVKAGMCDIPMVETGLFVNNMFRKCNLSQFGNNSAYNTRFHASDLKKKIKVSEPYAIGILGLYQTVEQRNRMLASFNSTSESDVYLDSSEDEATREPEATTIEQRLLYKHLDAEFVRAKENSDVVIGDLIDVGELNEADTLKILQCICSKYITIKYFLPNIYTNRMRNALPPDIQHRAENIISFRGYETDPRRFIHKFATKCIEKKYIPLGYLPWKLFKSDFIMVDKDPMYIYQFVPKIQEVISIVADICKHESHDERLRRYHEYFPEKD